MPHMFSDVGATIQDTAAMSRAELDFRVEVGGVGLFWFVVFLGVLVVLLRILVVFLGF